MVGRKVDADHPEVVALIARHQGTHATPVMAPTGPKPRAATMDKPRAVSGSALLKQKRKSADEPTISADLMQMIPEDIRKLASKTLSELVNIFGTDARFVDWLKATKQIEDIATARIKNAKSLGELVSQDVIRQGVVMPVDAAHRKILTDGARNIAHRAHSKVASGGSVEEVEKLVQDTLSSFLKPMKSKIERVLRGLVK